MSNERLRNQIAAAGLTVPELADQLELDPKSIERWITQDRLPHRRNRWRTSKILGSDEGYLWPSVADDSRARSASEAELVRLYPHRGAIPSELWAGLFDGVTDCVDLLVYSGLFLRDSQDDLVGSLAAKAEAGTRVRILLGEPDSEAVRLRGDEEGIGEDMNARARVSIGVTRPLVSQQGAEVRTHSTTLYNSIYRFDEHLLVNLHAYGTSAAHNPVLHLRRVPGGRLFDHYVQSFERVWETGTSLKPSRNRQSRSGSTRWEPG